MSATTPVAASIRALRAFVAERPVPSRCALCGTSIAPHPQHAHLFEAKGGRVACACSACAFLFGAEDAAPYRRLPTNVERVQALTLSEGDWRMLGIPIRLAFFVRRAAPAVECLYPSPAGPVASALDAEQTALLSARYPTLPELAPDVEALLALDLAPRHAAFRLPIDECYRLVGLVRRHWRGASGGPSWWSALDGWLSELARRAAGGRDA